jgi:hypothetical protein
MIAISASGNRMDSGCSFLFVARRVGICNVLNRRNTTLAPCSAFCNTRNTTSPKLLIFLIGRICSTRINGEISAKEKIERQWCHCKGLTTVPSIRHDVEVQPLCVKELAGTNSGYRGPDLGFRQHV